MKHRLCFLLVLGGLLTSIGQFQAAPASAGRPNILFILCDDLGINDLHCYGRQDHNTPHLDTLAKQGMRFTAAYCAQPLCSPS
ncbi:MAG TPA: sulfatase-like hydrolase/transferase, partial [Candidatus Sulfotelmatobacter sp.]|nr:sulfatase-like hydrolase/transferase [Candidatus Sulfotelmatobacter sp.]